jgi:hypothetical protein
VANLCPKAEEHGRYLLPLFLYLKSKFPEYMSLKLMETLGECCFSYITDASVLENEPLELLLHYWVDLIHKQKCTIQELVPKYMSGYPGSDSSRKATILKIWLDSFPKMSEEFCAIVFADCSEILWHRKSMPTRCPSNWQNGKLNWKGFCNNILILKILIQFESTYQMYVLS